MIAAARRFLYIENQYLTSATIGAAIARRMAEPDPPEFVLVMPRHADGWLEQKAMDAGRLRLMRAIGKVDVHNRFRVYVPVTAGGSDIYVHAKVWILDDRLLRVGSANLNNRSQGLDSECDVIIDAALSANRGSEAAMTALRHRLIAEHLDCTPEAVAVEEGKCESMIGAIEALRGAGKTLELLAMEEMGDVEDFIADHEILDPQGAEAMFDPIAKRGLARGWARGRALINARIGRRVGRTGREP